MVFTHLPTNAMLAALPYAPGARAACAFWLARASAVTQAARALAAVLGPPVAAALWRGGSPAAPFVVAGALKATYDVLMLVAFRGIRPPEEEARADEAAARPRRRHLERPDGRHASRGRGASGRRARGGRG